MVDERLKNSFYPCVFIDSIRLDPGENKLKNLAWTCRLFRTTLHPKHRTAAICLVAYISRLGAHSCQSSLCTSRSCSPRPVARGWAHAEHMRAVQKKGAGRARSALARDRKEAMKSRGGAGYEKPQGGRLPRPGQLLPFAPSLNLPCAAFCCRSLISLCCSFCPCGGMAARLKDNEAHFSEELVGCGAPVVTGRSRRLVLLPLFICPLETR